MDFHEKKYWDKQYKDGNYGEEYEWLGDGNNILSTIPDWQKYLSVGGSTSSSTSSATNESRNGVKILHPGCGNSIFGLEIEKYLSDKFGGTTIIEVTNVDYSNIVIKHMKQRYPDKIWIESDVDNLSTKVKKNFFDLAIEKGLADALLSHPDQKERMKLVSSYLNEAYTVLKENGYLFIYTLEGQRMVEELEASSGFMGGWSIEKEHQKKLFRDVESQNGTKKWLCHLVILQKMRGNSCPKCQKKNIFSAIVNGKKCDRCGVTAKCPAPKAVAKKY